MAAKKTKKQKAADAAFIKKISSITVGTGSKASGPSCPGCGEPMTGYTVIPAVLAIPIHGKPPKTKHEPAPAPEMQGEVAFSA
jgi:hypothetical protein